MRSLGRVLMMQLFVTSFSGWARVQPIKRHLSLFSLFSSVSGHSDRDESGSVPSSIQRICDLLSGISNTANISSNPLSDSRVKECMNLMSNVTKTELGLVHLTKSMSNMQCMHIIETSSFHMALFLLPKGESLSLHDHPSMSVCSKLIDGELHVKSYTPVVPVTQEKYAQPFLVQTEYDGVKKSSDEAWVISSQRGNIHEFTAVTDCTILDLLLPPYDPPRRNCNFYERLPIKASTGGSSKYLRESTEDDKNHDVSCSGNGDMLTIRLIPEHIAYSQISLPYAVPYKGIVPLLPET
mmetsp:Transcript_3032/g.5159  ORF Transcript_3032/g.5159 Transcript_3032/m.5159 type:complete len:296 (-) Transcript_3032:32-919(-)